MGSELVQPSHLRRQAVVYVRQSTPQQVLTNQESLRLQYALRQRAQDLGWRDDDIAVIDTDLGLSATSASHREGYKDLVARVAAGEVGIILSVEVTRLARNCTDWYPLLDVCGHRQCLIADRDGVYDPGSANGRLLLGLKGTISEAELHTIKGRLSAGRLAKAARGDICVMLPIGLVRDPSGVVTQDPDTEVQTRIALVFSTFLQVRTATGVVRVLSDRGLGLPRRGPQGDTHWRSPSLIAVTDMLKNPAYAGAFVYGRRQLRPPSVPGQPAVKVPRERADWRYVVKDRYPAYIDWDTYERIQAMLRDNRAEYAHLQTRGIPRDGAALLHGILWCGECGHKMVVRYKGGSTYVCNHLHRQHAAPVCQTLRAAPIDAAVAAAFLEAVAPAEIEAWVRARHAQRRSEEAMRRAEAQQVERLRYQASLAERQFTRVDPDNRNVAAELERRWEAALVELRRAEERLVRLEAEPRAPDPLDPKLSGAVVQLGGRIRAIWHDPEVGRDRRKALLRCLIDKVVARRAARDRAHVRIVWRGGETTELEVPLPVGTIAALPTYGAMQERLRALVSARLDDHEIAATLTAEGFRSPKRDSGVLGSTVANLRRRLGLPAPRPTARWRLEPGRLSVTVVAAKLGVKPTWIYNRLRYGLIQLPRDPATGRHAFPDTDQVIDALRRLLAGEVNRVDFSQHEPQ